MKIYISKSIRSWTVGLSEGGRVVESYVRPSLTSAARTAVVLLRGGDPRSVPQVVNNDAASFQVDRFVELHLNNIRSTLLDAAKLESPEADGHVIGVGFEVVLEIAHREAGVVGVHKRALTAPPQSVEPEASFLTPKQLAKELGTTNKTVLEWFHSGKIPAEIAEGAVYRFDPAKVKAALADRAADAVAKKRKAQRPIDRVRGGGR